MVRIGAESDWPRACLDALPSSPQGDVRSDTRARTRDVRTKINRVQLDDTMINHPPSNRTIVTTADRPDVVAPVANWLWRESWQRLGYTLAETEAELATHRAVLGPPQTFVLLVDHQPVGTASLTVRDLEERPDLTPWLADVFVIPEARGRGYVRDLLLTFDKACVASGIATAWLYTNTAERIYAKAGWQPVETIDRAGKMPVALMRRDYPEAVAAAGVL